jgi:hypothetical protein
MHTDRCIRTDGDWFCSWRCTHDLDGHEAYLKSLAEARGAFQSLAMVGVAVAWGMAVTELESIVAFEMETCGFASPCTTFALVANGIEVPR